MGSSTLYTRGYRWYTQKPLSKALDRPRFRGLQHQSRLRALKLPDNEKRVALWNSFSTLCSSDIALRRVPTWDLAPYIHGDTVVTPQVSIPEALGDIRRRKDFRVCNL